MSDLVTYRGVVYPWQCDQVGHMNVMFYVAKFDEATWQLFFALGLTPSRLRDTDRGMAAVEQHIEYKRELRAGDVLSIRSAVLDVTNKTIRFAHRMQNDETGELSATTTLTAVHLDTKARKSCPLPDDVRDRARAMITPAGS
jgi:acyl-CoA thioester hydrolase